LRSSWLPTECLALFISSRPFNEIRSANGTFRGHPTSQSDCRVMETRLKHAVERKRATYSICGFGFVAHEGYGVPAKHRIFSDGPELGEQPYTDMLTEPATRKVT
jgi:hypothetical protein